MFKEHLDQKSNAPTGQPPAKRCIETKPLTPETFASYGHVARPGHGEIKVIRDGLVRLSKTETCISTQCDTANAKLDFYEVPGEQDRLLANVIERHVLSSQMFSPMNAARWLVAIWPDGPKAAPLAFVAGPLDVVTYNPGLWHHGIVALDRPACFSSVMWKTGDQTRDTEFFTLDAAWSISWPDAEDQNK